jgi:hypothetical protein
MQIKSKHLSFRPFDKLRMNRASPAPESRKSTNWTPAFAGVTD